MKILSRRCAVVTVHRPSKLRNGLPSPDAGVKPCVTVLKQHFSKVPVRPNALATLPHFFSVLKYASKLTTDAVRITSRTITPSQSQNTMTTTLPADGEHQGAELYLILDPSLCLPSDL